jgi:hypothetical protein
MYTIFQLENLKGRNPFERPWHKWEDNIKMDIKDMWLEGVGFIKGRKFIAYQGISSF